MDCREKILSNDYYDIITDYPILQSSFMQYDLCSISVGDIYNMVYINRAGMPDILEDFFDYQTVPKLYGLMQLERSNAVFDPANLIASGITQVQRQPLNLTGNGVVLCIIDTGECVIIMSGW